jgi:hypothetical protein
MMDQIEIDLSFKPRDRSEAQQARAVLEAEGAREVREIENYGFLAEGVTFLAIITATGLVNAVIKLWQLGTGGIVVDTRGEKVRVTRVPTPGIVVVSTSNERVVVKGPAEMSLPPLLVSELKKGGHIGDSES